MTDQTPPPPPPSPAGHGAPPPPEASPPPEADRPFLPGLELSRALYEEGVAPLLHGIPHAAALVGAGSEVLGLDTARSTDHDWGPRLQLFVPDDHERVRALLEEGLPRRVRGWPTRYEPAPDDPGVHRLADGPGGRHLVNVVEPGAWFTEWLGFDPNAEVTTADWLATPTQRLAGAVAGAVFHDGVGELTAARRTLRWYPTDVWRYVLACQWLRIAQEEPFVGRCAETGDELGARVVAARLVRDLMRLCLLLARRYPPYSKWLGSAFSALPEAAEVGPVLRGVLSAPDPQHDLAEACRMVAAWQNRTGLAEELSPEPRPFHSRPYPVLDAARFTRALLEEVRDPALVGLPPVGAVDQYVDSTDALERVGLARDVSRAVGRLGSG
ncbi:DUF4037 domain-containing protein [Nocardiopsis sp. B62]|uniref:DUF4037 domain-containing protein n=1 Tax=Nocardiopsis sp. B62 TaxID=2824874 RepID=UPI001B36A8FA|nr:DUF4037 domain-containing protein [Nocardiopsis sp. B62]MBQ1083387.1 DUF4037 domain-containing protein [Nocardiopsis sp. B62]